MGYANAEELHGIVTQWRGSNPNFALATQKTSVYSKSLQLLAIALVENGVTGLRGISFSNNKNRTLLTTRQRKRIQRAEEDRAWFESNEDIDFSFVWCCEILNAAPGYFRKVILPLFMNTQHDGRKPKLMRRISL